MKLPIEINDLEVENFCRRHHIAKLAFFGSILTESFRGDSDVDVLVEFESEHVPGLLGLSSMERELSEILGREADLRTPKDLSRYFRDQVMRAALVQYAA
jgi:uncharacterized protein